MYTCNKKKKKEHLKKFRFVFEEKTLIFSILSSFHNDRCSISPAAIRRISILRCGGLLMQAQN